MPIILVYGMPQEVADHLDELTNSLQSTVHEYPELGLERQ